MNYFRESTGDKWNTYKSLYKQLMAKEYPFDSEEWQSESTKNSKWETLRYSQEFVDFSQWVIGLQSIKATTVDLERSLVH